MTRQIVVNGHGTIVSRSGGGLAASVPPESAPKVVFEPPKKKYNSVGANSAATQYKGACGTCGKNISYR